MFIVKSYQGRCRRCAL